MINKKQNPRQAFSWLMFSSVMAKVLGFFREIIVASFFGISVLTDALNVIIIPMQYVQSVIGGTAINSRFVKIFQNLSQTKRICSIKNRKNSLKQESRDHSERLLFSLGIITFILTIFFNMIVVWLAHSAVKTLNLGEFMSPSIRGIQISIWASWFLIMAVIIQAYLHAYEIFILSGLQDLATNLVYIIAIILVIKFGLISFALGIIVASSMRLFIQLPSVFIQFKRNDFSWQIGKTDFLLALYHLQDVSFLTFVVMLPNLLNFLIVSVTTQLGAGNLAAFRFAEKLIAIFQSVVAFPLGYAISPRLSYLINQKQYVKFRILLLKSLKMIIIFSFPVAIYLALFPHEIVKLIYMWGDFDEQAVKLTGDALRFYALALTGFAPMHIILQIYFIESSKKVLLLVFGLGTFVNAGLIILLVKIMGLTGIGLANFIGVIFGLILLIIHLQHHYKLLMKETFVGAVQIIVMCLISGIIVQILWDGVELLRWLILMKIVVYTLLITSFLYWLKIYRFDLIIKRNWQLLVK